MHRDFKLDNLLMNDDKIIIADFGLSRGGRDLTTTPAGTLAYMAPEMIINLLEAQDYGELQEYNNKVDLWSIGVALY